MRRPVEPAPVSRLADDDPWLQRVTSFCLALPEATRDLGADQASFRVRKKVFAYLLHDHDHDGNIAVCVKSALGEHIDRAGRQPELYYLPPYIGSRGWFGMRLNTAFAIDWAMVENIIKLSYELAAPKTLSTSIW